MTVEEQLRALCDHLDAQQAPVTSGEIIGAHGFNTLSGTTAPGRGGRWLAMGLAMAAAIVAVIVAWLAASGNEAVEIVPADRPTSPTTAANHDETASYATFVSPRNGFSVKYLDSGESTVAPATQLWGWSKQADEFDVVDTGSAAVFVGASASVELRDDVSIDDQVDDYLSQDHVVPDGCGVPRSRQEEITIDGESGRIAECPNHIEATIVAGGRLYLFALTGDRGDARAVFNTLVATIDLTPETAIDFPGLTTTFVSPTYGYSFGYLDRGGLTPATELWDPVNQPDDINSDHQFDAVETGAAAYFEAASTQIQGGATNDWIDEYITPTSTGGCGVPRRQQEEITIDGQPGRIARCPNQVEATVLVGERLYLFRLRHGARPDAREFFDAWIETIDLTPETAAGGL